MSSLGTSLANIMNDPALLSGPHMETPATPGGAGVPVATKGFLDTGGTLDQLISALYPMLADVDIPPILKALSTMKVGVQSGGSSFAFGGPASSSGSGPWIANALKDFMAQRKPAAEQTNAAILTPTQTSQPATPSVPGGYGVDPAQMAYEFQSSLPSVTSLGLPLGGMRRF